MKILCISPYSVQMQNPNNSVFGHFSYSVTFTLYINQILVLNTFSFLFIQTFFLSIRFLCLLTCLSFDLFFFCCFLSLYILIKPGDSIQGHLCKYKTMYKVQICYSNFLDNTLFIFWIMSFFPNWKILVDQALFIVLLFFTSKNSNNLLLQIIL